MIALARFWRRVSGFAAIYTIAMGLQLVLGLVTTIVIVRNLAPAAYGVLGLYLLIPSTVMTLANIGLLQGTNFVIFAHTGADTEPGHEGAAADTARRVLGTGLSVSLISGIAVAAVAVVLAPELSRALGNWPHGQRLVVIGAVSGALAGLWRFVTHMLHYARQPTAWGVAHVSRALFSLAAIVVLLAEGDSIEGVMLAFGIGSLIAVCFASWVARKHVKLAFDAGFAKQILHGARSWVVIVLAYQIVLSGGIYFVSLSADHHEVGLYSLATSLAVATQYAVSACIYSSGPLRRSSLRFAAVRDSGEGQVDAYLFEGFAVLMATIVLLLGIFGDVLVNIAPDSYAGAATLVPLLAMSAVGRGFFAYTYSLSPAHNKQLFQRLGGLTLVLFVVGALLLGPTFKAYGIAAAGAIAFLIPAGIQWMITQRGPKPLPLNGRRTLLPFALVGALVPAEIVLNPGSGVIAIAIKVAIVAAFVALLMISKVVPVRSLRGQFAAMRADPMPGRRKLRIRARHLAPSDAGLMRTLLRSRRSVAEVAAERSEPEEALLRRFLAILRSMSELDGAPGIDPNVARYLIFVGPYGERDQWARRLIEHGADPLALDRLEQVTARLRRFSLRTWTTRRGLVMNEPVVVAEDALEIPAPRPALVGADAVFAVGDEDAGADG